MSATLVPLALLMAAVTYPSRALVLFVPALRHLPPRVSAYLRLVGPAVLASLAAVSLAVTTDEQGHSQLHFGPEWAAVALCIVLVAWRRNLLLGLIVAAGSMALLRAIGVAVV